MAAFLNTPSDFSARPSDSKSPPPKLLPPSEFEKPKSKRDDQWLQELSRLEKTEEEIISALKRENRELRAKCEMLNTTQQTSSAGLDSHQPFPVDERRYADALISRQSEEISKLKSKVIKLEREQRSLSEQHEQKLSALERDRESSVAMLKEKLTQQQQEYDQQIVKLNQVHQEELASLQSRIDHLSTSLEQTRGRLALQVKELKHELLTTRESAQETEEKLREDVREKEAELQKATQQLQQLKTYVSESEDKHQPQQVWQQENQQLRNRLQIAESEKETLQSSVQLMEVRLASIKEILSTQEAELSKVKEETVDKNKQKQLLLTKWRQKVYALLVQQKSSELVSAKDLQNWLAKTSRLQEQLQSSYNTVSILQSKLADKDAELQLNVNTIKKLQEEVRQAEQMALGLGDRLSNSDSVVQQLLDFAKSCEARFVEKVKTLQQAMAQLKSLGQRVSFASSRMELVRSQLARREAIQKMEDEQAKKHRQEDVELAEDWRAERDQVMQELDRVRVERDQLASQLREDSTTWSEKFTSMRSQYDSEVQALKAAVEDLESINQNKSQRIEQLEEQIQSCQAELSGTMEQVEKLQTELARHDHTLAQALEDQKKELETEWTEQMAEMERKLNDARREHTKAVVTVRQLERQMGRERERNEEWQTTTEQHFHAQLAQLQEQLQSVERERNIFMATLRQEGLLGKLRSERGQPIRLQLPEDPGDPEVMTGSNTVTEVTETTHESQAPQETSETMSMLLSELRVLVPVVTKDDDENSEESSDENQTAV